MVDSSYYIAQAVEHGAKEARRYASLVDGVQTDDVLLDLGANVGEVSRLWVGRGALEVIMVEPTPSLVPVLRTIPQSILYSAAVVGDDRESITFIDTPSTTRSRVDDPAVGRSRNPLGMPTYAVSTVKFRTLLDRHQPTVVKCDIEGSEFMLLDDLVSLPDAVRAIAIEWHPFNDAARRERAIDTEKALLASDWKLWRSAQKTDVTKIVSRNTFSRGYVRKH